MAITHYDIVKSGARTWSMRLVRDNAQNVVYGDVKFRSKKRAQDWADRMNKAAQKCTPQRNHKSQE